MPGHADLKELNAIPANVAPANVVSDHQVLCADQQLQSATLKSTVLEFPPIVQRMYMLKTAVCVTIISPIVIQESARHIMISVRNTS